MIPLVQEWPRGEMSALGQKQTSGEHNQMSAYPPKADITVAVLLVR
jgi:hypothetical protein